MAPDGTAGQHGITVPRGLRAANGPNANAPPAAPGGRFGLMLEQPPCTASEEALEALARDMVAHAGAAIDNDRVPSGYTYLGQFIDHDLTFDPASVLQRDNDPEALSDFRTPALDLDSLYGAGPDVQPYLYDYDKDAAPGLRGVKLFVQRDEQGRTVDLQRNDQDLALLGDARDDENVITAQIHLLFARFHNILVDQVAAQGDLTGSALLAEAQRRVRHHYQWIVVHDFLPTFAEPGAETTPLKHFAPTPATRYMPMEFSAAAFRCGHSMVRSMYRLNRDHPPLPLFADDAPDLRGRRALTPEVRLDWRLFFTAAGDPPAPDRNRAMRVDQRLVAPLAHVPPDDRILPRLNLLRGQAVRLPSGQDAAKAMGDDALSAGDLRLGSLPQPVRTELEASTPLWFYLLREAAVRGEGGMHLGPLGARIVAEVILGLLQADSESYMNVEGGWTPDLGPVKGTFTMHDLVAFVEQHEP
jgi:hypothetical protein